MPTILMGPAKTLHTHSVLWAVPCPLTLTAMSISQGVLKQKFSQAGCRSSHLTNRAKALKDYIEYKYIIDKIIPSNSSARFDGCSTCDDTTASCCCCCRLGTSLRPPITAVDCVDTIPRTGKLPTAARQHITLQY